MSHRIWVILLGVLVVGCSSPPAPPDNYYRIYAEQNAQSTEPPVLQDVLAVRRFLSDGLIGERSLVYGAGDQDNPLQQYHYHHWTESPTQMLQEQLVVYLRRENVASAVVTPELQVEHRYELQGKIRRLEQIRGAVPKVVVDLELALTVPREAELVWVRSYVREVDCADDTLTAAVEAYNQAVSEIFAEFARDFRAG